MNKPLTTDESTPSRGAMTLAPTAQIRTTQATLIAVISAAVVCGGYLVSIDTKMSNQSERMKNVESNVDRLMRVVFFDDPRMTGPIGYPNPKTQPKASAAP